MLLPPVSSIATIIIIAIYSHSVCSFFFALISFLQGLVTV